MARFIIVLGFLFSFNSTFAQKVYVWDPQPEVPAHRPLFTSSDTVDIVVFDGRNIPRKTNNKYTSEELVETITNNIMDAYEGATFIKLGKEHYYKDGIDNHVTIKVGVSGYHAGFGTEMNSAVGIVGGNFAYGFSGGGKWNCLTSFFAKVYDRRDGNSRIEEKEIISLDEKPNSLGFSNVKKSLRLTYSQSMNKLFSFIDSVLMK